jgi:electron transport complex protein RnfE
MSLKPKSNWELIKNGIFGENTIFRMAISLCPSIAVTNGLKNGVALGVSVVFVQTMVNFTISIMRKFIHPKIRIPIFMLVIAGYSSVCDGLGMGIGFLLAMVVISFFRELLGKGELFGYSLISGNPLLIMILPAGGFIAVGLLMGFFNWVDMRFFGGKGASGV